MSDYESFMVYELDDSGEKVLLDVPLEDLQSNLHPEQVLVIVREELRRIYIWKGPKSPVRKRFISSRIAQALQEELMNDSRFHRCKIVSVDAGDEPIEFLNAFQLESMVITEKLDDLHYVRNIDKEKTVFAVISDVKPSSTTQKAAAPKATGSKGSASAYPTSSPAPKRKAPIPKTSRPSSYPSKSISESRKNEIIDKILENETPANCERLNLIISTTLYAAVSKTANVFGEDVIETNWEPVKKVPKDMIELNNHVLRVYFGEDKSSVEAIEVLKKLGDSKPSSAKTTAKKAAPKKKPAPKKKVAPKKKPTPKKKAGMTPMPEKPTDLKSTGRRSLPKIPSTDD